MRLLLTLLLAGCGTTVNLHGAQPNLQSINLGQPGCMKDCQITHTATQGDGATGSTVTQSDSTTSSKSIGASK